MTHSKDRKGVNALAMSFAGLCDSRQAEWRGSQESPSVGLRYRSQVANPAGSTILPTA
jgi:hypothetical protein